MNFKQQLVSDLAKLEKDLKAGLLTSLEYINKEFAINRTYIESMSKARKRIILNK